MLDKIRDNGVFRGWFFWFMALIGLLFFLTPEREPGYWSYMTRLYTGLGLVYVITRGFLASDGSRTHTLTGWRRNFRELAIAIMVLGAFVGAGAGAFG